MPCDEIIPVAHANNMLVIGVSDDEHKLSPLHILNVKLAFLAVALC